jgi:hypothetical protein
LFLAAGCAITSEDGGEARKRVLQMGPFGDKTLIDAIRPKNPWMVILPVAGIIAAFLALLELLGG